MPDREKAINSLTDIEQIMIARQEICPREELQYWIELQEGVADALALLKEQEVKEGHWIVLEFCANEGIYCSECHMKIFDRTTKPKEKLSQYCPHCGSRNEQFFRDGEVVFR